jgi:gluconokinase
MCLTAGPANGVCRSRSDSLPTVAAERAETPFVLALDLGSSSLRAIVYDAQAREVDGTEGRRAWQWTTMPDGGVEGDPDALLDGAFEAVDQSIAGAGSAAQEIKAVGVSTFWHNIMGVGRDGRPTTALYSWADTRAAAAARVLRERMDQRAVRRRTGCVFHPSYPAARLLWLRGGRPDAWPATRTWMSIGEYLALRCFGRTVCSVSMASGTGMLDLHRCEWDAQVLEALGIDAGHLAPLADLDAPLVGLSPEFAARWPAVARVPWLPAAGDGALSNLGAGCTGSARAALAIGTSGALRVLRHAAPSELPDGLWHYRLDRSRLLTGGAVSNGGNLFQWMQDQFVLGEHEAIERGLQQRRPDGHGLVVLPFLAGERSPRWPLAIRGAIVGLTLATDPLDLLQAGLEAIAHRFGLIWDLLRAAVPEAREIVVSGGALLRSPAWTQILADVLGHTITVSGEPEGSSRGAALLALELLGAAGAEETAAPLGPAFVPDPARHASYCEARAKHLMLERALTPLQEAFLPGDGGRGSASDSQRDRVQ